MQDPYFSVESMLCWQIENLRKRADEQQASLIKCGELYPLPKPTDGLPDSWAFGKLTCHQVALAHGLDGIKWVFHQIEKAESALSSGDFPTAIYWVVMANNSIQSTSSSWQSSGAVRMYRYIRKIRLSKSQGGKNRWKNKPKPSKEELLADREEYYAAIGHYQGWLKQAIRKFSISGKTINALIGD